MRRRPHTGQRPLCTSGSADADRLDVHIGERGGGVLVLEHAARHDYSWWVKRRSSSWGQTEASFRGRRELPSCWGRAFGGVRGPRWPPGAARRGHVGRGARRGQQVLSSSGDARDPVLLEHRLEVWRDLMVEGGTCSTLGRPEAGSRGHAELPRCSGGALRYGGAACASRWSWEADGALSSDRAGGTFDRRRDRDRLGRVARHDVVRVPDGRTRQTSSVLGGWAEAGRWRGLVTQGGTVNQRACCSTARALSSPRSMTSRHGETCRSTARGGVAVACG
jgi:hypothetical protein